MKRVTKLIVILFAIPLFFACQGKNGLKIDYEQYSLDNGLKVVLSEDHSDPIVGVAIQFHVGSGREKEGKTGFAHFFEHMLFQRSENLPRNAFFQKIASMGGDFNGGTGQDGTIYYEAVPRDALEKVLWMESDRMGYFINTVTQAGLDREIDVILNEKRQTTDNEPYGQLFGILSQELFPKGHPYSWSVIGHMDDIRSATIEDVKEFYSTYYIPRNATIAISGDFDPATVKELLQKYFGEIPAGKEIEKPQPWAPKLDAEKRVVYEDPFAPLPYLVVCFPGVEKYNEDSAPLSILGELLGGSKKSPLYKTIVEGNLAPGASAFAQSQEVAGMFGIEAQAYDKVSLDTVYAAIQKAFEMFEANGIDPIELQKIKVVRERNSYNMLNSVQGKANSLANNMEYGGKPDRFIDELNNLKKVTAEDVMRVYNKYIKGQNFLAISMVPKGWPCLALSGSTPATVEVENVEDASSQTTRSKAGAIVDDDYPRTPSAIDRSIEPPYMANSIEITPPTIWNKEMSNGLKVYGIYHDEVPLVNFQILIKGGMVLDPIGKEGISTLNAALMNEGTALRSADEIGLALSLLGANANVYSEKGSMGISGLCLSRTFPQVMEIVEEMLLQPRFDESILEREKNKIIAQMQQNAMDPEYIATTATSKLLFGEDSFQAKDENGTVESLNSITMEDIKAFYAANFSPRQAAFLVAGAVNQEDCEKAISNIATKWNGEVVEIPQFTAIKNQPTGKTYFIDYPGAKQSFIFVSGNGSSFADPNYYALRVLNFKLGSGSNGELFNVLRLQRGYTYGAYSAFMSEKNYGYFTAESSVQATVTKESVNLFKSILGDFGKNYTQEILDATKNAMLREQAFAFETQRALLSVLQNIYFDELPADYLKLRENVIKSITLDDIKTLSEQYLDPAKMNYVVVGDAKTQFKKLPKAIKMAK